MMHKSIAQGGSRPVRKVISAAVVALMSGQALAFQIDNGNPDVELRWDNTIKYNAGWRMEKRDDRIGDNWAFQAGEYKFDRGDMVANRVDLLTEVDFVFKKKFGARVSGAAWYDGAYNGRVIGNPAYQAAGMGTAYANNRFTNTVNRYYTHSGELLDAFVFGTFDVGTTPVTVRAGKHTVYWGESLFSMHGAAYSQGPMDLRKAAATPGSEAKELFLPLNQISGQVQLTDDLTVAAQYFDEWKPFRIPDGGTYQMAADPFFSGGTSAGPGGPAYVGNVHSGPFAVPKDRGNWGVMSRYKKDWLNGTVGVYYREFDDKIPNLLFNNGALHNAYATDVKLWGLSYSTLVGATSVGMELTHRKNAALSTIAGSPDIARGDTWHMVVNSISYLGKTALYDSAPLTMEFAYARLDKADPRTRAFFNERSATCSLQAGCATKDSLAFSAAFAPVWYQVMPGVDVSMPMFATVGLSGNSPMPFGSSKNAGSWNIGVGVDYQAKYKLDIAYNDSFGSLVTGPNGLSAPGIRSTVVTGGSGLTKDRGWLSVTLKTNF